MAYASHHAREKKRENYLRNLEYYRRYHREHRRQKPWKPLTTEQRRRHTAVRAGLKARKLQLIASIKGSSCTDCGKCYPPYVMDFDHLPQFRKIGTISRLVSRNCSLPRIKAEIAKCELVCSNCHRLRTLARRTGEGQ